MVLLSQRFRLLAAAALLCCVGAAPPHPGVPAPKLPEVWMTLRTGRDSAILSPDGNTVAVIRASTPMADADLGLYRRDTKRRFLTVRGWSPKLFAFTSDGKRFVTVVPPSTKVEGERGATIGVHEVETGKRVSEFDLKAGHGRDSLWALGGNILVITSTQDGVMTAYDIETGKRLGTFDNKGESIGLSGRCMALSADGKWLMTASGEKARDVRLWDVGERKLVHELYHHAGQTHRETYVAVSADGRWCATASFGGQSRAWVFDSSTGEEVARADVPMTIGGLLFGAKDEQVLLTGSGFNHGIGVWDWRKSKEIRGAVKKPLYFASDREEEEFERRHHLAYQICPSVGQDGSLLTLGFKNEVRLWKIDPPDDEAGEKAQPKK